MDSTHDSLQNYRLHHYALLGDDEGVRNALQEGADINALDGAGRTAIMCAVAGEKYAFFYCSVLYIHLIVFLFQVGRTSTRLTRLQ